MTNFISFTSSCGLDLGDLRHVPIFPSSSSSSSFSSFPSAVLCLCRRAGVLRSTEVDSLDVCRNNRDLRPGLTFEFERIVIMRGRRAR